MEREAEVRGEAPNAKRGRRDRPGIGGAVPPDRPRLWGPDAGRGGGLCHEMQASVNMLQHVPRRASACIGGSLAVQLHLGSGAEMPSQHAWAVHLRTAGLPLAGRGGMAGGRGAAPGMFVGAGGRGMVSLAGAGRMGARGNMGQGFGPPAGIAGGRGGGFAGPPRAMMPQNAGRQLSTAWPLHVSCTAALQPVDRAVCT
jgi:hypothetical protein